MPESSCMDTLIIKKDSNNCSAWVKISTSVLSQRSERKLEIKIYIYMPIDVIKIDIDFFHDTIWLNVFINKDFCHVYGRINKEYFLVKIILRVDHLHGRNPSSGCFTLLFHSNIFHYSYCLSCCQKSKARMSIQR